MMRKNDGLWIPERKPAQDHIARVGDEADRVENHIKSFAKGSSRKPVVVSTPRASPKFVQEDNVKIVQEGFQFTKALSLPVVAIA